MNIHLRISATNPGDVDISQLVRIIGNLLRDMTGESPAVNVNTMDDPAIGMMNRLREMNRNAALRQRDLI